MNKNVLNKYFPLYFCFLFLHHLVRISLPILQGDLHQVLPWREALQVDAFYALTLRAHQASL